MILPPLALYVHVPWCLRKCPYCDFNSHPLGEPLPEDTFIAALLCDLEQDLAAVCIRRPLTSIFIGGGTPSLLSGTGVMRLLNDIRLLCPGEQGLEITLEANPGAVAASHFATYRQAGVNRLSIGVQSFNSGHLAAIGRIHGRDEALQAVATAKATGFTNINLDLMFGLPGQTVANALQDLQQAIDLQPEHLSWYQLTLEPNTAFFHTPPQLPGEDLLWAMQRQGQRLLKANGFRQYEVSAYARAARHCQHNLNYWQFGDYLGIGPGAHGKLTGIDGQVYRTWKLHHPTAYLEQVVDGKFLSGTQILEPKDLMEEFLLNALRLREGFALQLFEARTGLSRHLLIPGLARAQAQGLLTLRGEQVHTTSLGYRFLNQLLLQLVMTS